MSHGMANLRLPNLHAKMCLEFWKHERQTLLCLLSQLLNISPFEDERHNNQPELQAFCSKLLTYIHTDYFANLGLADLPMHSTIIAHMLRIIKFFLRFHDQYANLGQEEIQERDLQNDLLALSENLAAFLDLEEDLLEKSVILFF